MKTLLALSLVFARTIAAAPELSPDPQSQAPAASEARIGDAWSDPRNPIVRIFGGQRLDLWSLKPIQHPSPPRVKDTAWPRNTVDQFILAKLEAAGLQPSPEADKRTLARRVSFDLIGLPPSPTEMARFLNDDSPQAYERFVDHLLDSPRYGEHWARQWLDVVRYSDSNGFDWDEFRPRAWLFRDYVIRAFNADKPFDQFITEQLAGDELVDGPPKNRDQQDALIATTYLRLGPHDNSAPLFNEQARSRAELMSDLVETTGSAFLGLTMACCRCHDHKFDPLSQADHYRLRAFFEPVKFADDKPLNLAPDRAKIEAHNARVDEKIKPLLDERAALLTTAKERVRKDRSAAAPPEKASEEVSEKQAKDAFTDPEKKHFEELSEKIEQFKKEKRPFELGLLMTDGDGAPPATHILYQGDYKKERAVVESGFISALDPNAAAIQKAANPRTTGRRYTLARWIIAEENPLTARVLVNRVWQGHFGRGLVATPNDFGLAGERPTHPALLDWLASEFREGGWSLKRLHRLIVTSATYRQSSAPLHPGRAAEVDGDNSLLWRQNLRRLTAEQLRDSLLFVAGTLRTCTGGPPRWPKVPTEILQANPAFLDDNAEKTKGWYPSPPSEIPVRSIYLVQKRNLRVPFMETFDLPENAVSCPRRSQSVVAPQALSLLNGPEAISAVNALAHAVADATGPQPQCQVAELFARTLQRAPDAGEEAACLRLLTQRSLAEVCRALLNVNEFAYID